MNHRDGDAFDRVHPDLIDLMLRVNIDPPIDPPSEDAMARSIYLAIQMADELEQVDLVERIIPEEELAAERLAEGDFLNLDHRITLDEVERLAALRATPEPERQVERLRGNLGECIICGEGGHVRVPCNCVYCYPCLRELIRRGLAGLTEFPPRCCVHFREETIRLAQRPALVHLFRQLEEESEVPLPDRLYCHDPHCAAFIPLDCHGECLICEQLTCQRCGGRNHGRRRCDEGEIGEDLCVACRAEFCLICGERWKSCDCELYGGHNHMVPMRRRPGRKPERYRRAPRNVEAVEPALRIPQLRPRYGEEDRGPRVTGVRRRTRRLERLPMREHEHRERNDAEPGPAHEHHRRHHGHREREEEHAGPAHRHHHHRHRVREEEAGPAHREHRRHRAQEDEDAGPAYRRPHGLYQERDYAEAGPAYGRHHHHREREEDQVVYAYRRDRWDQVYERPQPELVEPEPMPDLDLPPPAMEAPEPHPQEERIVRLRDVVDFARLPPPDPTNIFTRMEDVAELLHEVYIPEGQHLHVPMDRQRWDIFRNREDVGPLVDFAMHQAHPLWDWRFAQAEALGRAERIHQWAQTLPGSPYHRGPRVTVGNLLSEGCPNRGGSSFSCATTTFWRLRFVRLELQGDCLSRMMRL
ncbi:uncharacterized protein NECHADRAFT_75577 [Fusarium vanettenii 77-13-4]|uniref:RING-type domain-containing protein n=1 Tax=Fusarium vanettenii (strain ATCC MYA-4622 / CBS 123669 / FGSC 9596 / NRRL 45880 / 77-13-4) TaxID=660122 RepID=C7YJ71_FUSV7|nr:uncharacterized protein NECHADRAFT_75577 [Fusarium vanettenii 77-13-4]EEU48218.1 hypothetical protein NECHADRAFT_75577 [Fusarium vanettenii 77-13-4]